MESRLLVLGFVTCFALVLGGSSGLSSEAEKYLAPGDMVPFHYDLRWNIHSDTLFEDKDVYMFDGRVRITMVPVKDKVQTIVIHCRRNIDVTKSLLFTNHSEPIDLGRGEFDLVSQKLSYPLKNPLKKSEAVILDLVFVGKHLYHADGFYRESYMENGKKKVLIGTKFQATFARGAFPCIDEPKYKTTFNISVSLPKKAVQSGFRVLANTAQESVEKDDESYIYHFKKTPIPMSSYLVAILVSDFQSTPPMYFNATYVHTEKKEFRTWSLLSVIGKGNAVQVAGVDLMKIYERDYKIGYGYDKMDQVSVPDFPGGMENWGLIYYWEPQLMFPSAYLLDTVLLMAHEISHQWFGNLVTCHWWSDTWLNEGFATYHEYFGADKIRTPVVNTSGWLLPYQYVIDVHQIAFQWDVPGLTHAMTVEIYQPDVIMDYFDQIEYLKAGSVIRMWANVLGTDTFTKALQEYFKRHKESATYPQDLMSSFDCVANQSVSPLDGQLPSKLFKCWIVQEGYPVVSVFPSSATKYTLTQEVFRYRHKPGDVGTNWTIPISYSTSKYNNFNQTRAEYWLREDGKMLNITLAKPARWIVVNNQESGYYRVNYDPHNWKILLNILANPKTTEYIHDINKAQIIDDVANLARSTARDYVSYSFFMDLTTHLENETKYHPWKAALNNFKYLERMLSKDQIAHSLFKEHVLRLMRKPFKTLTPSETDADTFPVKELRSEIVSWMSRMGDVESLKNIRTILNENINNIADLPHYILPVAYCSVVKEGDDDFWRLLWQMYLKSENFAEKKQLMGGLSCTSNNEFLKMLLERTLDRSEIIGVRERQMIFSSVYDNDPRNVNFLFDFVSENLEAIYELYGGSVNFDKVLTKLAEGLGTDEEMAQMKALLTSINYKGSQVFLPEGKISRLTEILEINNDWLKERCDAVLSWLISHYAQ